MLELTEVDRDELLETIRTETKRLDRLVAKLLDLSLLEAAGARVLGQNTCDEVALGAGSYTTLAPPTNQPRENSDGALA